MMIQVRKRTSQTKLNKDDIGLIIWKGSRMKGQLKNKKKNVKGRRDVREWKKGNATLR